MIENKIEQYYKMAEAWAVDYLANNTEPKSMSIKQGEFITDDLKFIDVSLERLRYSGGKERYASYLRIKEFKDFINKCKPIVDKII